MQMIEERKNGDCRGFTLLELSVLMICIGFLMVGAITVYDSYMKRQNRDITIASLEIINAALMEYRDTHGFYPRPAKMNLAYGDPGYGEDFFDVDPTIDPAIGACAGGICRVAGKDAEGDGTPDNILIGEIPFETLNSANI